MNPKTGSALLSFKFYQLMYILLLLLVIFASSYNPPVFLSVCLFDQLAVCLSVCLFDQLAVCLSIRPCFVFVYPPGRLLDFLPVCRSNGPSVGPSSCLSLHTFLSAGFFVVCLSICLSSCLHVCISDYIYLSLPDTCLSAC